MTAERLLNIIFEDDRLLVVCKPADLVCHPTKNGPLSSLIGRIRQHLSRSDAIAAAPHPGPLPADAGRGRCLSLSRAADGLMSTVGEGSSNDFPLPRHGGEGQGEGACGVSTVSFGLGGAEAFMINRLDRETSGLVLVAKERRLAAQLHRAFWHKQVLKEYLAIVHGPLRGDHGEIDAPIALVRDHQLVTPHSSLVTPHVAIRRGVEPDGQPARTEWWVEGRAPKFTLLRLRLHTGRAHQIRVHLAHIGHPIVGDKIYGGDERLYLQFIKTGITPALLEKLLLPRHGLHAERLVVPYVAASHRDAKSSSSASRSDAATGAEDPIEWRAPLPEDLAEFWRQVSATPAT